MIRWIGSSIFFLLFLLLMFSLTNPTYALENNQSFLIGMDTSFRNHLDSLAFGANFPNPQIHKGLALGVVNLQLSQVAGVSTVAADGSKPTWYTALSILTGAFLAYYLITKNLTAHEKPLRQ